MPLGLDGCDEDRYNRCWGLEGVESDGFVAGDLMTLASATEAISARSESMASGISGSIKANV